MITHRLAHDADRPKQQCERVNTAHSTCPALAPKSIDRRKLCTVGTYESALASTVRPSSILTAALTDAAANCFLRRLPGHSKRRTGYVRVAWGGTQRDGVDRYRVSLTGLLL